ncbi:hypothetical protein Micbo1qcDRAFT_168250 [Microdochium bolleyi]|uniref:Uncharacterized protein n=1 Tax=Microdochium bolleyi TaxID=196109 RepID=A0A136IP82_9PEZI|nr:hypothetical protein Micbo1qcDRAFT_168250 [Microdochium bolleyi]
MCAENTKKRQPILFKKKCSPETQTWWSWVVERTTRRECPSLPRDPARNKRIPTLNVTHITRRASSLAPQQYGAVTVRPLHLRHDHPWTFVQTPGTRGPATDATSWLSLLPLRSPPSVINISASTLMPLSAFNQRFTLQHYLMLGFHRPDVFTPVRQYTIGSLPSASHSERRVMFLSSSFSISRILRFSLYRR